MYWRQQVRAASLCVVMGLLPLSAEAARVGALLPAGAVIAKGKKTKEQYRDEYFKFAADLFRWAAKAKSMFAEHEDRQEVYFRFTSQDYERLQECFDGHRDVLSALGRYHDLNMIEGHDILPKELYHFIRQHFALSGAGQVMEKSHLLQKIVGGELSFANGRSEQVVGLLEKVDEFDLASWTPVQTFINQFKDTLTLDSQLASQLGRVLLPLMSHYYRYMDTVSRLRLFKEIAEDYASLDINGQALHDWDQLAIKVFQSSGPVLIKFLQQLQEETVGETPISRVLEGLKQSKPMPAKLAERLAFAEVSKVSGAQRVRSFSFNQRPLGIASIAQTHLFHYREHPYIIKLLKDKVKDVFEREKTILRAILDDEKNEGDFDKGLKQSIENMIAGIEEEIDFNYERRNLVKGFETYNDERHGIATVDLPANMGDKAQIAAGKLASNEALIMSVAAGEPLGTLMKRGQGGELEIAYGLVQNLYRAYLRHALAPGAGPNFYHGDLHRENMFIDLSARGGQGLLTLIDFGNAGELSGRIQQSITKIMRSTKKTASSQERDQDDAIVELGKALRTFILEENGFATRQESEAAGLLNSFFTGCFNPLGSLDEKMHINKQVHDRKRELAAQRKALQVELALPGVDREAVVAKIKQLQDDIDFANALLGNCLNGVTNPLLTALASPHTVSDKLAIVFQELQKNGIALPKEVIFFNKSKSLLEGIMTNLAQKLDEGGSTYRYVEPEDIFDGVLKELGTTSGGNLKKTVNKLFKWPWPKAS